MAIKIVGYDIVDLATEENGQVAHFVGVVHLDANREPVDMPFEGKKLADHLGFNAFIFKDPDEVRNPMIEQSLTDIRDRLTDHLLAHGVATGEYEVDIPVQ